MMGYSSLDDLVNEITNNGKFHRNDWNKINGAAAYTAGRWYDWSMVDGSPPINVHGNIVKNSNFSGGVAEWANVGTGGWAWNIAGNIVHTAGSTANVSQTSGTTIQPSTTYTVVVTTSVMSGTGGVQIAVGGTAGTAITTATTTTQTITTGASPTQLIEIIPASGQTVTVDDLYVFEGTTAAPRFMPYVDQTRQGGIYHGGNVSTDTKHVLSIGGMSASTFAPCTMMLVDMLGAYPRLDGNSASVQNLNNTNTLQRYANGKGVRAFVVASTTMGAVAHNIALDYTNDQGTAGRGLGATVAGTASAISTHIAHSGTAANNYGPFLPLAAGDNGIRSVQSFRLSAATGTANTFYNLVLAKPLCAVNITSASIWGERDLLNQLPSLPQVQDGAYLAWLHFAGAATAISASAYGSAEFGWG